jgi:hypothetical protein
VNKQARLDAAEIFDSWRVVPRIFLFGYSGLVLWLTIYLPREFFALPAAERTTQVTAFAGTVLTAAYGALPWVYKIYADNGRNWDAGPQPPAARDDEPYVEKAAV